MNEIKEPVHLDLDLLHPHPEQDNLFAPPSPQEIQRLSDDIVRNGLRQPIEVLSDGTIIRGHSRVLAAKHAGKTALSAIVREDLDNASEAEVLKALAEDNLNRRHLGPLEIAKSFAVIAGAEVKSADAKSLSKAMSAAQQQIATQLGISRKTLQRYLKILDTPLDVQHAVAKDYISMDLALAIHKQKWKQQQKIAAAIKSVVERQEQLRDRLQFELKNAVTDLLGDTHQQRQAYTPVAKLVKALRSALEAFGNDDSPKEAHRRWLTEQRPTLVKGQEMLTKIIKEIDELTRERKKAA